MSLSFHWSQWVVSVSGMCWRTWSFTSSAFTSYFVVARFLHSATTFGGPVNSGGQEWSCLHFLAWAWGVPDARPRAMVGLGAIGQLLPFSCVDHAIRKNGGPREKKERGRGTVETASEVLLLDSFGAACIAELRSQTRQSWIRSRRKQRKLGGAPFGPWVCSKSFGRRRNRPSPAERSSRGTARR